MVLYNARIITMTGKIYDNGFIEIRDGKIYNIGAGTPEKQEDDGQYIDLLGKTVYPGFIDIHSHIGVW